MDDVTGCKRRNQTTKTFEDVSNRDLKNNTTTVGEPHYYLFTSSPI